MSLRLCMLFIVNKHLYAFYIYMRNLSRADGSRLWFKVKIFLQVAVTWPTP